MPCCSISLHVPCSMPPDNADRAMQQFALTPRQQQQQQQQWDLRRRQRTRQQRQFEEQHQAERLAHRKRVVEEPVAKDDFIHGRWLVIERLGSGTFGSVYMCRDVLTASHVSQAASRTSLCGHPPAHA